MTTTLHPTTTLLDRPERRVEGDVKVTGQAKYVADFAPAGMLWAAFVRGTSPHARIAKIDSTEARSMPGVRAVLTGAEIGERFFGRALCDRPVLAYERVRFVGEYVAAVAAETRAQAEAAAQTIVVEYDDLPAVFDPEDALAADALVIHEHPEKYPFLAGVRPAVPHPNIQGRQTTLKGDPDAGFAAAARTFEHRFTTPRHHGGYIEPHAALVWIDPSPGSGQVGGIVHVISGNKGPLAIRKQMSVATGVPEEQIIVEQAYIGGDFGAKGYSVDEFACYFLAKATGRPVKAVRSHVEDVESTNTRHAGAITLKSGVAADGTLCAFEARVVFNGGAYAGAKPVPWLLPGGFSKTPYRVEHARTEFLTVYTNTVPAGHVRAPSDIQIAFAIESHLDMIARELGIDPIEFRLRNAIVGNETDVDGRAYVEPRAVEILETIRREVAGRPLPPGHGRGVALSVRHIGHGFASVKASLGADGIVTLRTGMADQGVAALTMMQRVLAHELGLEPERVRVLQENSSDALVDLGPGASRVTHVTGRAVLDAAAHLRAKLTEAGWDGSAAAWTRTAAAVAAGGPLDVVGTFKGMPDPKEPESHNFSGCCIEVSVDRETGALHLHDALYVADVGAIINPIAHQGQIDGGFVFGIGHALMEELQLDGGRITTLSLSEYKLPTQKDVPPLRTIYLKTPGGPGPFGAKMAGELSTAPVAPAIANAVAAACGARVTQMPITSERVYDALHG
jgi:CO/xanthine dehydrogenase Mo-binding subunit